VLALCEYGRIRYNDVMTKRILIVEDDPVLCEAYVRKFKQTSYEVDTAVNGTEAVEKIKKQAPDLVICDILMPEHDGWWVLEQFPKESRSFPIIMLTNLEDATTRDMCMKSADGYFVKRSMTLLSLIEMANTMLSKSAHQ
jgi:CheY-like chemotaxis protein